MPLAWQVYQSPPINDSKASKGNPGNEELRSRGQSEERSPWFDGQMKAGDFVREGRDADAGVKLVVLRGESEEERLEGVMDGI